MTDINKIRKQFITAAAPFVFNYIKSAKGEYQFNMKAEPEKQHQIWLVIKDMMLAAGDQLPRPRINGKTTEKKVEQILTKVAAGTLTPDQG